MPGLLVRFVSGAVLFFGVGLLPQDALGDNDTDATNDANDPRFVFFEKEIRPLFVARCLECHGPEQQWAGLRLDTREGLLKGGESGPAVIPGQAEESLLLRAVRHEIDAPTMPPDDSGEKLSEREVASLVKWISAGAVSPADVLPSAETAGTDHWAFLPPTDAAVPEVRDAAWPVSVIDRFILVKLEAENLSPAPPADRATLLRRVTYDLVGLPPTVEEVQDFLADDRPDAYERVVDRLLASPAYGERWGRHWLDVARYADSNGLDENVAHGNAWRYRDYVVAAFNEDKRYDQFLREQIAGDLLEAADDVERRENLIATGFLALGPKVLAEVDPAKMEMDIVDEQVDTVGRAFLGMTFGCARCHDHKFDPISIDDYYAIAGIFKSTRTMETFKLVAKWHENVLPSEETRTLLKQHEQQIADAGSTIAAAIKEADEQLVSSGMAVPATAAEREALYSPETKTNLERLRKELATLEKSPPDVPSAMGASEGTVVDVAVHLRGSHLKLGEVVARGVPGAFSSVAAPEFPAQESGRLEFGDWLSDPAHPLTARVMVNRVWRWHFGTGLVRTPDNFGLLGAEPTHPELLDWLACRLVEDGWSIKQLHRRNLLSSTYRQSDVPQPEVSESDPENRLWGRMPVRRLEAEAVRDALFAVSGGLDRTMGGSLLTVKNRDYFFNHTSKDTTTYASNRRAIYLPIVRNNVYDVLGLLDFPDPAVSTGDRPATTTAPQALFMMNSEIVADASDSLAQRILNSEADDTSRVVLLYQIAYGRAANSQEIVSNLEFLRGLVAESPAQETAELDAWRMLCQVALSANEFIYVR